MDKEKNFISAVVYVRNEQNRIEKFINMLADVLGSHFEHSEIICVNDYSNDDSLAIIRRTAKEISDITVTVVNLSHFHGVETGIAAGSRLSIGDFILEFDSACLEFAPEAIMTVYRKALTGYDIVSAIPDKPEKMTSRMFYDLIGRFSHIPTPIHTEYFRILSRRVFNRVDDANKIVPYRKIAYANAGLPITWVKCAVVASDAPAHKVKGTKHYKAGLAVDSLVLFTDLGFRFSLMMTIMMMLIAVFMGIYSIFIYLSASPVEGWTTTILFLSAAFFGLFGVLTVVIKYLSIIVNLLFKRKSFTFESIEKLTK